MEKEITYYCSSCYREFKTLDHFNRYVNLRNHYCSPMVRADRRRRLTAKKIDGRWQLVKFSPKEWKKVNSW